MISVIISSKNGSKYILNAIQSVLNQSFDDIEIIVVSDGSTDDTAEIVRKKSLESAMVPIKVIELKENIGPGLARNLAILGGKNPSDNEVVKMISPCQGEYIALIDDDDVWTNTSKLANQKKFLDENPDFVLIGSSHVDFIDESGKLVKSFIGEKDPLIIRQNILRTNPVITSSVLFRKSAFEKVGGFKNMYLCEDYDLWLRMGLIGKISNIENAEVKYTIRKSSASGSRTLELFKTTLKLVVENRKNYPGFLSGYIKGILRIVLFYIKKLL